MRPRLILTSLIALSMVLPTAGVSAVEIDAPYQRADADASTEAAEGIGTDNFQLVQNLPHSEGGRGSDIEFATLTYDTVGAAVSAGFRRFPTADALPDEPGVQKDIALAGTTGTAFYLYDITDPENVYETAAYECPANQGDTQVFTREVDGATRTYTTYTVENGSSGSRVVDSQCAFDAGLEGNGSGTFIIDITDPFDPVAVSHIPVEEGSHNGTVDPSGNYFYNSNSSLYTDTAGDGGPGIEYYDISDIEAPVRLGRLALPPIPLSLGTESHDITFNADGTRAYSAALSQGVILDTTDPAAPTIITSFVDPTINVWHQSDPITLDNGTEDPADDRELLVVEDEVAGAIGTGQCPNGGVHVFDITGDLESTPVKLGYWNIDEPRVMADPAAGPLGQDVCTAHVFRLYPEAGLMTISYYNGGVRVVDLNGLVGIGLGAEEIVNSPISGDPMVQIGSRRFDDSNSWAAKSPRIPIGADGEFEDFYVFSNGGRGLDVLKFEADAPVDDAAVSQGRWMTPAEAEVELTRFTPAQLAANPEGVCFL